MEKKQGITWPVAAIFLGFFVLVGLAAFYITPWALLLLILLPSYSCSYKDKDNK